MGLCEKYGIKIFAQDDLNETLQDDHIEKKVIRVALIPYASDSLLRILRHHSYKSRNEFFSEILNYVALEGYPRVWAKGVLNRTKIETTQFAFRIRPAMLKQANLRLKEAGTSISMLMTEAVGWLELGYTIERAFQIDGY